MRQRKSRISPLLQCRAIAVIVVSFLSSFLGGCGAPNTPAPDAGEDLAPADKAARCATAFATTLTPGFGRVDGTVLAVVPPAHPSCARPNDDHLVLQVAVGGGAVYRMVVNVQSDRAGQDPRVRFAETTAPLVGPAWAEGWHNKQALDYANTLGVHADKFTPYPMAELVGRLTDRLALDARVSIFATTSGGDSAHLIHRNSINLDGAIVVSPDSQAPTYLLLAFDGQVF